MAILLAGLFLLHTPLFAQQNPQEIVLHINPILNGKSSNDGLIISQLNGDSIAIHTLRFYLSNFVFYKNGKEIGREKDSYHLLDMEDESTLSIAINPNTGDGLGAIRFDLGTDSLTNVSGAMGGDLDPANGMYWAWNSGYINFKIEGYYEKCPTRNHQFQFHIGGYLPPFKTVQTIELTGLNKREIWVDMELSVFFEHIDLAKEHSIMSPSKAAANLAQLLSKTFRIHGE
ncbi:MAG: hypothetical protein K9J37_19015 [Saprospiraceae bacterium]|nr:hypothetical protein [Saprospiraceae bacterium]MCF8252015.1 hypothetical protein [Saprospiraceae bacterium]MCF8281704.1 hypothetical protein [Bacteroidales bacterium]MCF8313692.1 hypothetical protein [Saprospiraceae bacterium]MCF8442399.1 hypothetical protein [Saprospiraceae bacterium]